MYITIYIILSTKLKIAIFFQNLYLLFIIYTCDDAKMNNVEIKFNKMINLIRIFEKCFY